MIEIDGQRLLADLRELAGFGRHGTGVHRLAFSPEDIAARRWLRDRLAGIGLEAELDGVGNVLGRAPGDGPCVLIGSHTDTVPRGGWLDGALGVVYGLEIARSRIERLGPAAAGIDVVSFQDEEGTFLPCLGSRSFCGDLAEGEIEAARDVEGRALTEAIRGHGLDRLPRLALPAGRYRGYLEAHIEQGPRLEADGVPIGVVTGIVGIRRFQVSFTGQADHAGTTPMAMRKDAGAALIDFAAAYQAELRRLAGPETVWNFGKVTFQPGAANVVPAATQLLVEMRDMEPELLDRLEARLRALVEEADRAGPVAVALDRTAAIAPVPMDAAVARRIAEAAERCGAQCAMMPSGAGHDAMVLARHVPAGMLFIPSIGGRSHDISEDTAEADIIRGCQVLAEAAALVLEG